MATPSTRATDSDRNNTCQALDAALDDGQLSMEEHRQRVSAAVKSTYLIINGRPDGSLDLSIYVSDTANNSGYIQIAPDATVKAIYPPDY